MYFSNVMSCSIKFVVLFKVLVLTLFGSTAVSKALNRDTLVNESLNIGLADNEEQESTSGDLWSMVASMRGNADAPGARMGDQSLGRSSSSPRFDWGMNLDQEGLFHLDWSVDYARNLITFSLEINQTSLEFRKGSDIFALGFSKDGRLSSSDFCIVWYDLGHRMHLQDALTDSNGRLELVDASKSHCKLLVNEPQPASGVDQPEDAFEAGGQVSSIPAEWTEPENQVADKSASELESSHSRILFRRPLDVCTGERYYSIDNGTTHLVWFSIKGPLLSIDGLNVNEEELSATARASGEARSQVTPSGVAVGGGHLAKGRMTTTERGDNRFSSGMKRVQLIAVKAARRRKVEERGGSRRKSSTVGGGSGNNIEIRMESFRIPAQETTYWCKLFKFPHKFVQRRYHITRYEAVIEKGNEHVVHHMELFNCANLDESQELELEQLYRRKGGWSGDCNARSRPQVTKTCRRVILAWAMGAHPLEYPDQVGQSVGGRGYSPYIVLEVHYNNVQRSSGLIDNSGLSFQYTSRLRPFDAGILEVGLEYSDKNSIPPGQVFPLAGHCVSECTRAAMTEAAAATNIQRSSGSHKLVANEAMEGEGGAGESRQEDLEGGGGIYIFAAQMHTHLAGVATWTEHVREGRLLGELQRDNHYSPHFQEIRLLSEPVHVAPGDALIHYCLYDTRNRTNITLGGYATSEEMCVTYLHYYPRIDLELCKSSIDTQALEAYFAYLANEESQRTSLRLEESSSSGGGSMIGKQVADADDEMNRSSHHHPMMIQPALSGNAVKLTAKSVRENYQSIDWTPKRARDLLQLYSESALSVQCNRSNGDRFPGFWSGVAPTRLWADLEGSEPFGKRRPTARQLLEYRGSGFGQRHEQCKARAESHEQSH